MHYSASTSSISCILDVNFNCLFGSVPKTMSKVTSVYFLFFSIRNKPVLGPVSTAAVEVFETPPTNLQRSELVYPWETFLDSWICLIERSWLYDGLYLVSIACI